MKPVAENRRAGFDIAVEQTLEAGMVLTGDEIKSIRANRVQLTGAYVKLLQGKKLLAKPVLVGAHFSLAAEPERSRPLLLSSREIRELEEQLSEKGKTAVPLNIHLSHGWAKLTIGIGKGRKNFNKKALLKERDIVRDQDLTLKSKRRND